MDGFRKAWMPWKAADRFSDTAAYHQWLKQRLKVFGDVRVVSLAAAAVLLLTGYVLELRPVMLATILPLAAVLLLSLIMEKTAAALENKAESET